MPALFLATVSYGHWCLALHLVNAVKILFHRRAPSIATCGHCTAAAAAMQADLVKPSKSHFPIKQFSCLAFLRLCVGGYLHISEVSPPSTPTYLAISTAPPKIQLSPPVPPIPQQSPFWCQISDTRLCLPVVKAEAFWPQFSMEDTGQAGL